MELLAPGGDVDCIKAAILAGADAVYCGLDRFNARNRAENIRLSDLNGILRLAHKHNCKVFLTVNILIVEAEMPALIGLLNHIVNTSIDGVIVQDLGLLYLLKQYFPSLRIHASTQMTTHNAGQIGFLKSLGVERVNLSRELSANEINAVTLVAHDNNIQSEVFVHGSHCICFSGLCYMSSMMNGNSGNRGRCSQPCRSQYMNTPMGKDFPLNLKDNSAYTDLQLLYDIGVDALKIEGRIKKFHYVYAVVDAWRKQLQRFYDHERTDGDSGLLYKIFNRDFSNAYLKGDISKEMFIDNPRDHSAIHHSELNGGLTEENLERAKGEVYDERTELLQGIREKIQQLCIAKDSLIIRVSGSCGLPLKVEAITPSDVFEVYSGVPLTATGKHPLNDEVLFKRLKLLNDTEYFIERIDLEHLDDNVFLSFREQSAITKILYFMLNGSRERIEPVVVPSLGKHGSVNAKPTLSIMISSIDDAYLSNETLATVYYQLPNCFSDHGASERALFHAYKKLRPCFPAVLIGEDYATAVELLQTLQPECIITNNSGIAFEAGKCGISWIAGPAFNAVNSYSVLCLHAQPYCVGSFISNELSRQQIRGICKPSDFPLFYSLYHPMVLMTSRQCLFHTVTGCEKFSIAADCLLHCEKATLITNMNKENFLIEKSKGNYHRIIGDKPFLNTDIVTELPDVFNGFFIDLSVTRPGIETAIDKPTLIALFNNLLQGHPYAKARIMEQLPPSTQTQYLKGI